MAIDRLPGFCDRVDAIGFDELWFVEDCFAYGAIAAAAVALAMMERAGVGIGLLPAAFRNPALAAMELATIAELFPGRLRVAFGHGVESWMAQVGPRPRNRIAMLREVVDAVDQLLRGRGVTSSGEHVSLSDVALNRPPACPPELLIGTTGRQGAKLATELGAGVLLPEGSGPAAVSWMRARVGPSCPVVVYAWLVIDDDRERALGMLAPAAESWRQMDLYPNLADPAGIDLSVPIPAPALAEMAVAGPPADCARAVVALGEAGATAVAFIAPPADPLGMLERFSAEVAPLLREPAQGA
jgi:alkanesulfonate monooxygenase SsuD/methylene tetrahydromethanopterin reductase-like flavin-dependent oxidoreductase (luciferase family)